ncbi:MAG: hypothetical protein ACI9TH_001781 [Kiritimatiellia bacterium]|jgi:hypothetical protein
MLKISPNAARLVNRRSFLQAGALAPLGLSLPTLYAAENRSSKNARAKSVILIFLGGGISHHDTFDPKPDAVEEIRGKYGTIPTSIPGLRIGELLPNIAPIMDKLTLVRSQSHTNNHHETASNWVLSGKFGSARGDHPAIGAVVAHATGFKGVMPPYVAVPKNPSFTWELGKSAWLGGRFEAFKCGDPNVDGFKVRDLALSGDMTTPAVARRQKLLQAVDHLARRVESDDRIATFDEFGQKAVNMVLSPEARGAFDLEREDAKLRDEYGRHTFGQSCLMARRLVENGVRFVTVNYAGWDHHAKIFEGLDTKLPEFDQGFAAFMKDMETRGLLDDTMVAVFGEFGRTPKINDKAGRDHWNHAGCMMFAGAGVKQGQIIGASDKNGAYVIDRPISPADVAWTIYDALGIDPREEIVMPDGRPTASLSTGAPIHELYG